MFNLTFVSKVFQLLRKTTSEDFVAFKIDVGMVSIVPFLFDKSFEF